MWLHILTYSYFDFSYTPLSERDQYESQSLWTDSVEGYGKNGQKNESSVSLQEAFLRENYSNNQWDISLISVIEVCFFH